MKRGGSLLHIGSLELQKQNSEDPRLTHFYSPQDREAFLKITKPCDFTEGNIENKLASGVKKYEGCLESGPKDDKEAQWTGEIDGGTQTTLVDKAWGRNRAAKVYGQRPKKGESKKGNKDLYQATAYRIKMALNLGLVAEDGKDDERNKDGLEKGWCKGQYGKGATKDGTQESGLLCATKQAAHHSELYGQAIRALVGEVDSMIEGSSLLYDSIIHREKERVCGLKVKMWQIQQATVEGKGKDFAEVPTVNGTKCKPVGAPCWDKEKKQCLPVPTREE